MQFCNTTCNTGRPGIIFPELPERGNCAGLQPYLSIAAMPRFWWISGNSTPTHVHNNHILSRKQGVRKKKGAQVGRYRHTLPFSIASRSLLRNMPEAFKGTNLASLNLFNLLNAVSWRSGQPKDQHARAKVAQSL